MITRRNSPIFEKAKFGHLPGWLLVLSWLAVCLKAGCPASAAEQSPMSFQNAPQVADGELGTIRGGLMTRSGLQIDFGIERVILVNGVLTAQTELRIPVNVNPADLSAATDSPLSTVVQLGTGNSVAPQLLSGVSEGAFSIIQNSLDYQQLQNLTILDVNVRNLNEFKLSQYREQIRQQIVDSIR